MNFKLSEEQTMLKESVTRFIRERYDFDQRKQIIKSEEGYSPDCWATFAELGWLSIPFAEEYGGFGGTIEDVAIVMEEMGKGMIVEPYVPTVLMFGQLLALSQNNELKSEYIPKIIDGSCLGAFAFLERQSRYEITDIRTKATVQDDNYIVNGEKAVVYGAGNANALIITVRTSGEQFDRDGVTLLLLESDCPGVETKPYQMMDGQMAANVTFNNVSVPQSNVLGSVDAGAELMETLVPLVILATSAEALGIMSVLNELTISYAKTRNQFGAPISSFQALQHRMVDNFMAVEQSRSMLYRGLCAFGEEEAETPIECLRSLHAMKVIISKSAKRVGEDAVQIHGGMGMTDELNIGHYLKRLISINTLFGDADFHQKKFNELSYKT